MQCKHCGCEFEPTHGLQRYCSLECRDKQSGRNTHQSNTLKVCQVCGKEFLAVKGSEKFCGQGCKQQHRNERSRAKYIHVTYVNTCQECGTEFVANRRKQYCSEQCKNKHKYEQQIIRKWGSVNEWQEEMRKRKATAIQDREAKAEAKKIWYEGTCVVCGAEFKTLNPAQKTCSKECGKRLRNARKQKRIPKEQIVDKDITLEALYRRDSGVCYLCGKVCDWTDKRSENIVGGNYPSIDHIIPIARGGLHSWSNVRLAHFNCNVAKSDSLISEAEKLIPDNAYQFKRILPQYKKTVEQLDLTGNVVAKFESTAEAERQTGIKQRGIQNCARHETKTYCGYVWKYV